MGRKVKSEAFVKNYFSDPRTLVKAIIKYHQLVNLNKLDKSKGQYTLLDLLNQETITRYD
ncbi:MAG: hypothetical protein PUB15_02935 [Ruminobacter sp.]|nr:hypothetical protein [Ruminobacter sp.]